MHEQKRVPGTGAERLVFKEVQVSALQTDFCPCSRRSLQTAALWQQELALRAKTLSWGTLGVTICVPAARGQRRSAIKGDPSAVRTPGFCQVREEMVFLTVAQKVRDEIL